MLLQYPRLGPVKCIPSDSDTHREKQQEQLICKKKILAACDHCLHNQIKVS